MLNLYYLDPPRNHEGHEEKQEKINQAAVAEGGLEALLQPDRRQPNRKNRFDEATEAAVCAMALEQPACGQVRVSNELRKRGIFVSASGVRCVWRVQAGLQLLDRGVELASEGDLVELLENGFVEALTDMVG